MQPLSPLEVAEAKCDVLAGLLNSAVAELAAQRALIARLTAPPQEGEVSDAVPA